jgi:hypothetical protein
MVLELSSLPAAVNWVRMNRSTLPLLALTLAAIPGVLGADLQSAWSSECARRIISPEYLLDAVNDRLAGTVSATFAVDSTGTASQLRTEGPILANAVDVAIRKTVFPEPCEGRSVATKFSFTIDDDLSPQLKPITVCYLLANPTAYAGRDLAILGRSDQTFDGSWLSEDNCEKKGETAGYVWPNTVWIQGYELAPGPPLGRLILDESTLSDKLVSVHHTTALKMEERLTYNPSDKTWQHPYFRQTWAIFYGRVEVQPKLRPPKRNGPSRDWGNGFGHMNAATIQVLTKQENSVYIRDDDPVATDSEKGK